MSFFPYEPFRHLENRRTFDHHFGPVNIEIQETKNEVIATCSIPGIQKKEDVKIEVDQNTLTISGTTDIFNEVKGEHMHRQERFVSHFQRSVALPCRVNATGVKSTFKSGILEIRMSKL